MKSIYFLFTFLMWTCVAAQTPPVHYLKSLKAIPQADYIQLRDHEIVYPVTGLTEIHMEQVTAMGQGGAGGGLFAVIEMWVVDATGKIVYNNVHTINPTTNPQSIMDADYVKYMKRNEFEKRKKRR